MNWGIKILAATLLGSAATLVATQVYAQAVAENSGGQIEEIVVTAEKRATTVQNTPVSIAAVTGDELQDRGITSLADLAQATPGVSLKSEGPSQTEIEMRGMTSSGGNSRDGRLLSRRRSADRTGRRAERPCGDRSRPL